MIKIEIVVSGEIDTNCYLIFDDKTKAAIVVDPGLDAKKVIDKIKELGLKPELLVNTHGHFDHIGADDAIRKLFNVKLAVCEAEVEMLADAKLNASVFFGRSFEVKDPEIILKDGEIVKTSFCQFKVITTPGHTKGGICLLFDDFIITGDTLFKEDIGRTDLKDGSYETLIKSLDKIKKLDPKLIIYPGHGPSSTLEHELKDNSYLR